MSSNKEIRDTNVKLLQAGDLVMRSTWLCMTRDLGIHNNAFGGVLLSHVDEVVAAFAAEICDTPYIVTKTMNTEFIIPIKVGNLIKTYCGIESIGNTSINMVAEMRKYNVRSEAEVACLKIYATFVRIDEEGHAIPISKDVKERYSSRLKSKVL